MEQKDWRGDNPLEIEIFEALKAILIEDYNIWECQAEIVKIIDREVEHAIEYEQRENNREMRSEMSMNEMMQDLG